MYSTFGMKQDFFVALCNKMWEVNEFKKLLDQLDVRLRLCVSEQLW